MMSQEQNKKQIHVDLLTEISNMMVEGEKEYENFVLQMTVYVSPGILEQHKTLLGKLGALEKKNILRPGNYDQLKKICSKSGNEYLIENIETAEKEIMDVRRECGQKAQPGSKQPKGVAESLDTDDTIEEVSTNIKTRDQQTQQSNPEKISRKRISSDASDQAPSGSKQAKIGYKIQGTERRCDDSNKDVLTNIKTSDVQARQNLQQHLVDEYQKEDVKTSISPLMTQQNNVNISDVYASPRMVVEENDKDGNTTEAGKHRATNNKHIEIGNLFGTDEKRNRKIFIVGDVGTGKSSLCKMMMQHWCSSIKERRNCEESGVKDEEGVTQEKDNDTYGINQFDFLFHVPLREMQEDTDDIVNMIKGRLKLYENLVDDIFTNDSERVLILADGLDELTPSKSRRPQWIPKSSLAGGSTILTTSRPSSRGILKMKSSDFDLKVTLLGLKDENSVQYMINKYIKLIDKKSDVADFNKVLSNLPFRDIKNAPMLLQQIIWLYCNVYNKGKSGIDKSRTSIYIHIVNVILGWEYERHEDYPKLQSSSFKQLSLPKSFDKYPRCQENKELLLLLGKIAYNTYVTGNDSSLVFGRYKMKQLGVLAEDIDAILLTGILTEINCADPTYEKSRVSFIHTSYVEFFAALYICSCCLLKVSDAYSSGTALTLLEGLIAVTPETSVAEILRLENVLIMICGLVPSLTEHVCECIYKFTPSGEIMDEYIITQIQDLTFDCLSEHDSVDQGTVNFKLRHLDLFYYEERLSDLDPSSIETSSFYNFTLTHEQWSVISSLLSKTVSLRNLHIYGMTCTQDHTIDLTNYKELQTVKLIDTNILVSGKNHQCLQSFEISYYELSHEQCSFLSSFLSQTVSLRTLDIELSRCTKRDCEGHTIYLTDHKELQSTKLSGSKILVSDINNTCPLSFQISDCELSHEQCYKLVLVLSRAVTLRILDIYSVKCTKVDCEGHTIDLSDHRELQSINLFFSKISISGKNYTCLQSCEISDCQLSHKQCVSLTSFLSQAVSLQTLRLNKIKCCKGECEDHTVVLTHQRELKSIELSFCKMSVSGINKTCPQSFEISDCELSHEQCSSLLSFLSQAVSLRTLKLNQFKCNKGKCEDHTIILTNHRELQTVNFSNSNISVSGINHTCPKSFEISDCELSHEQCSSLSSFLSHTVALRTLRLNRIKCSKGKCKGHTIVLTHHRELQTVKFSCSNISVSGINHTCPQSFEICYLNVSHEHCSLLSSFLSQAVSLRTLKLCSIKCLNVKCESHDINLTDHRELQSIQLSCSEISVSGINYTCPQSFEIEYCQLSHEQCSMLSSFLSQAESLQTLRINYIKCTKDECEGHSIDVSNHRALAGLTCSDSNIFVSGVNSTVLNSCILWNCRLSHEQCTSLLSCLSQATLLTWFALQKVECINPECYGHCINLSSHNQMDGIHIKGCDKISFSGVNHTCLTSCYIDNCKLTHDQYSLLSPVLAEAESLEYLTLRQIKCIKDACEGHYIDLTNHKQLHCITISNCNMISITGMNATCLWKCDISNCILSHEQCASLCTSLSHAKYLRVIKLSGVKRIENVCEGHNVDLTNHKKLNELSLSNCCTIYVTGMNSTHFESFNISNCNLSHEQCASLCTSLSKAESLQYITLSDIKCIYDACEGHYVDLTNHKQLRSLSLSNCNCNTIAITGKIPTCHPSCYVSNCNLSHEQCASLCTFLSQKNGSGRIKLTAIKCSSDKCQGHFIDFSKSSWYSDLKIQDCENISWGSIKQIEQEHCYTDKT